MEEIEQRLLNEYQHHFPLIPEPYAYMADELKTNTQTVIDLLIKLNANGKINRVGPVFKPNVLGVSTLAAMSIPADQLIKVATIVNEFSGVNHNYEREHHLNLWFVIVAANQGALNTAIEKIEHLSGYKVMQLPLLKEYHIDLGFKMGKNSAVKCDKNDRYKSAQSNNVDILIDKPLVSAIQAGLPLTERPYLAIGTQLGLTEKVVINKIRELQSAGVIRRFGVIVRHHELGYRANAMLVWNVPDDRVDELGKQLSLDESVTLCYQRPRVEPDWQYNLFSMIHGKSRDYVMSRVEHLVKKLGLEEISHEILFSRQRFKQCGAKYFVKDESLS